MKRTIWLERMGLVCLFLSIISMAIFVTVVFQPLYYWEIDHAKLLDFTTLSKKELMENYNLLIRFLIDPLAKGLHLPDFKMSAAGASHFYDVKKLILLNEAVFVVSIIPAVLLLRSYWKQRRMWRLVSPMRLAMMIPIVLMGVMAVGFTTFFVKFHEVLFSNQDWLFDPVTDPIINVLPETFFMHCFLLFFLLVESSLFLCFFLGKREFMRVNKN